MSSPFTSIRHAFRLAALAAIPMALLQATPALAQATKSVEVLAIVEHPALDEIGRAHV